MVDDMCVRHGKEAFAATRATGWSKIIPIFSPSLAHFPRPINTITISMIGVQTLREGGSFLGFSLFKLCSIFSCKTQVNF